MNVLKTKSGDTFVRKIQILWRTDEGAYEYILTDDDIVTLEIYDGAETIATETCVATDGKVTVSIPEDVQPGIYHYALILNTVAGETFTITESTIHIGRR